VNEPWRREITSKERATEQAREREDATVQLLISRVEACMPTWKPGQKIVVWLSGVEQPGGQVFKAAQAVAAMYRQKGWTAEAVVHQRDGNSLQLQ
jgi:hypothetical protein